MKKNNNNNEPFIFNFSFTFTSSKAGKRTIPQRRHVIIIKRKLRIYTGTNDQKLFVHVKLLQGNPLKSVYPVPIYILNYYLLGPAIYIYLMFYEKLVKP